MGNSIHDPHSKRAVKSATKNGKASMQHAPGGRSDPGRAFLPDPYDGAGSPARSVDPLAETLAEEFVTSATNGEEMTEDDRDQLQMEEVGGPFTETSAEEEFATEPDESNPKGAKREAFPTATRPLS
jgi:hypothetical protein